MQRSYMQLTASEIGWISSSGRAMDRQSRGWRFEYPV